MRPTVLLLAGEASGDEHGAALAGALRARHPGLRLVGTGGPCMEKQGVDLLAGLDQLAVMGVLEVVPRLAFLRGLEREIRGLLSKHSVSLVVPIDYPGFNMRIARAAHGQGVPVLYYIAPKVWASRPGRARELARVTERVAAILPFEVDELVRAGVRAEYVGHPLLDRPDAVPGDRDFREHWGLDADRPLLAVLPGSRPQEVAHHLGLFTAAARLVQAERPDVLPVLSRARTIERSRLEGRDLPVVDDTRALLRHASVALVKSGTSTLESALERTPMAVAYRTSRPTWLLMRMLLRTEFVSLPNLVAGRRVVPELLQGAATARALADELLALLDDAGDARADQLAGFESVAASLGGRGSARRVADLALELMGAGA